MSKTACDVTGGEAARARGRGTETGSALVIAILIMVIMSLMGLAFALVADTENKISINERHQGQALYAAEGTVRLVKKWFDDPTAATGFIVPTTSQMNRSLRYVDNDGDGTYTLYSSAPSPWNVIYRSATNDPFEKPYRGSPSVSFEGTQSNPDVRISAAGSSGEQSFLTSLNNTLFPNYPATNLRAKIRQIDVYAPPIRDIGGQRVRYGVASILVTVGIYEKVGTASEAQIAERVVRAVINEAPYPGPVGPLQSCADINTGGAFNASWGKVTSAGNMYLASNIDVKVNSSVPFNASTFNRFIARDNDLDGTILLGAPSNTHPDDMNGNGTADFNEWRATAGAVEDPWVRYWSQGTIDWGATTTDCATPGSPNCQPLPWYRPGTNTLTNSNDHSNLFKNISIQTCPSFPYSLWKSVALSGQKDVHYFAYDSGTGLFRENGVGTPVDFVTATDTKNGLFFFDTIDGVAPHDDDANGTYDNLTPDVSLSGGAWQSRGFIYLNSNLFRTTGGGSVHTQSQIMAPGEPWIDVNGDGSLEDGEYFIDVTYPTSGPTGSWTVNDIWQQNVGGHVRQDPSVDAASDGKWMTDINMYGVFYTNGSYDAQGNWNYFGSVITKEGMLSPGSGGTPNIYFDERLVNGAWPPPSLHLARTIITEWETDM